MECGSLEDVCRVAAAAGWTPEGVLPEEVLAVSPHALPLHIMGLSTCQAIHGLLARSCTRALVPRAVLLMCTHWILVSFVGVELQVVARDSLHALCRLHEASEPIVHRDIKPSNLLVNSHGKVMMICFSNDSLHVASSPQVAQCLPLSASILLLGLLSTCLPIQLFCLSKPQCISACVQSVPLARWYLLAPPRSSWQISTQLESYEEA